MNVSEELKDKAVSLGLCDEWTDGWGNPTKGELVDKYLGGLDFCILNDYPSNEFIKTHFGEIAEKKGVFVDKKSIDLHNPKMVVLNGDCSGDIKLDEFSVCEIHVRHNSSINIIIEEYAMAFIRVYDNAEVTVSNNGYKRSFVYKYGGSVNTSGDILVREKQLAELG